MLVIYSYVVDKNNAFSKADTMTMLVITACAHNDSKMRLIFDSFIYQSNIDLKIY